MQDFFFFFFLSGTIILKLPPSWFSLVAESKGHVDTSRTLKEILGSKLVLKN